MDVLQFLGRLKLQKYIYGMGDPKTPTNRPFIPNRKPCPNSCPQVLVPNPERKDHRKKQIDAKLDCGTDCMQDCECESLMKHLSLSELNQADRIIVRMLHKKCAVIARARSEIINLDKKFDKHIDELKRCNSMVKGRSKKKWGICILFGVLVTAWIFIMYGIVLGSLICAKLPHNCHLKDTLVLMIPGLSWSKNEEKHVY